MIVCAILAARMVEVAFNLAVAVPEHAERSPTCPDVEPPANRASSLARRRAISMGVFVGHRDPFVDHVQCSEVGSLSPPIPSTL